MICERFELGGQSFVLKNATKKDINTITRLYNQGNKTANADLWPVSTDSCLAWFERHGEDRPVFGVYTETRCADGQSEVTEASGLMVAWASLSNLYDRPAYHISAEISIYIDDPYLGQGMGTVVLEMLLKIARTLGIKNVCALIFGDNTPSLALFGKFHFENWGYLPKVCQIDGVYKDVLILGKAL